MPSMPSMSYVITSFNHKNSSMSFLESISLNKKDILVLSSKILENKNISELVILSTCNRVEFLMSMINEDDNISYIFSQIASYCNVDIDELNGHGDTYRDNSAIHHLFCVASSLESMVIGETQIMGQLKSSFQVAIENDFASKSLSRLIHYAFKCSADIRNSSDISKNSVSIASIAILKLKEIFSVLDDKNVIIIGSGEMSKLVIKHLSFNVKKILLFNRSIENIQNLQYELKDELKNKISIKPLDELKNYINDIDILFTATSSDEPIVTDAILEDKVNKKVFFDLALPKDIVISKDIYKNIDIISIEDLEEIAKRNTSLREEQAKIAYSLVGKYIEEFVLWSKGLDISPLLKDLRKKAENIAKDSIKQAIKKKYIKEDSEENVTKLVHNIFNKFLHSPSVNLKNISNDPEADCIIDNLKYLFDLEGSSKSPNPNTYKCDYKN